ncbi:MAG: twin-arginine translocation signal domain-containing protein [Desulfovibrionaceae bacterium]|nr:twin-arginine translocation signal domain-containing protein [Desulfovibrionaceae bacterium]
MTNDRRTFLKGLVMGGAAAALAGSNSEAIAAERQSAERQSKVLHVWSCGGLAEAMHPAHKAYQEKTGVMIAYTGAFAGALGKSLLSGKGQTLSEFFPAVRTGRFLRFLGAHQHI